MPNLLLDFEGCPLVFIAEVAYNLLYEFSAYGISPPFSHNKSECTVIWFSSKFEINAAASVVPSVIGEKL